MPNTSMSMAMVSATSEPSKRGRRRPPPASPPTSSAKVGAHRSRNTALAVSIEADRMKNAHKESGRIADQPSSEAPMKPAAFSGIRVSSMPPARRVR